MNELVQLVAIPGTSAWVGPLLCGAGFLTAAITASLGAGGGLLLQLDDARFHRVLMVVLTLLSLRFLVVGETVTFRARNAGKLPHSFTLGTRGYQQRDDREMMLMHLEMRSAMRDFLTEEQRERLGEMRRFHMPMQ